MRFWRKRICDATFYFFSLVGVLTYVPSLVLSIREGVYVNAVLSTVLYGYCVVITFLKRVNYSVKAASGTILFFIVGLGILLWVREEKGIRLADALNEEFTTTQDAGE